jgi:hypothetical protein
MIGVFVDVVPFNPKWTDTISEPIAIMSIGWGRNSHQVANFKLTIIQNFDVDHFLKGLFHLVFFFPILTSPTYTPTRLLVLLTI